MYRRNKWGLEIDTWVEKPCSSPLKVPTPVLQTNAQLPESPNSRVSSSPQPKYPNYPSLISFQENYPGFSYN